MSTTKSSPDTTTDRSVLDHIDLFKLALKLWDHRRLAIILVAGFFCAAIFYLHGASYSYTAELVVTPADQPGPNLSGGQDLASLVGINISSQQGSAAMYVEAVKSYPAAERLSRDQRIMRTVFAGSWDSRASRWYNPGSFSTSIKSAIKNVLGIPNRPWQPPGAQDLQQYIESAVGLSEDTKKGFIRLTYRHSNPDFAKYFLERLNDSADSFLRDKSLARSLTYIRYLERRLREVQVTEYRQSLSETLSTYERTAMMASSDASFAVETFGNATVSPGPTSPNPRTVVLLSIAAAIMLWIVYVLFLKTVFDILWLRKGGDVLRSRIRGRVSASLHAAKPRGR